MYRSLSYGQPFCGACASGVAHLVCCPRLRVECALRLCALLRGRFLPTALSLAPPWSRSHSHSPAPAASARPFPPPACACRGSLNRPFWRVHVVSPVPRCAHAPCQKSTSRPGLESDVPRPPAHSSLCAPAYATFCLRLSLRMSRFRRGTPHRAANGLFGLWCVSHLHALHSVCGASTHALTASRRRFRRGGRFPRPRAVRNDLCRPNTHCEYLVRRARCSARLTSQTQDSLALRRTCTLVPTARSPGARISSLRRRRPPPCLSSPPLCCTRYRAHAGVSWREHGWRA